MLGVIMFDVVKVNSFLKATLDPFHRGADELAAEIMESIEAALLNFKAIQKSRAS